MFIMSSCVPERTVLITLTWSLVIFRLMPAVLMRWEMASSRPYTPLGILTSSRLRCVLVGSALSGITLRSMWSDSLASELPFAFLKSKLKCPIINLFLSCTNPLAALRPAHGSRGFKRGCPFAQMGVFSGGVPLRQENALLSYGFSVQNSHWGRKHITCPRLRLSSEVERFA